jgi:hypothetical protein
MIEKQWLYDHSKRRHTGWRICSVAFSLPLNPTVIEPLNKLYS